MRKWAADYGNLHVIVCDEHKAKMGKQIHVRRRAKDYWNCYFCLHPGFVPE